MWRSEAPARPEAMIGGAGRVCPTTSHRSKETDVLADLRSSRKEAARRWQALASGACASAGGGAAARPALHAVDVPLPAKGARTVIIHVGTAPALVSLSRRQAADLAAATVGVPADAVVPVAGPFGLQLTCTLPCSITFMLTVSCC